MTTANALLATACVFLIAGLVVPILLIALAWLNDRWQRRGTNDPESQ